MRGITKRAAGQKCVAARSTRRNVPASLGLTLAVLLAAACGGGGGGSEPPPAVGNSPATPAPGASPPPGEPVLVPVPEPSTTTPSPGLGPAPAPGAAPASYTVSGKITVGETNSVDSDTNDPQQVGRRANDTLQDAQELGNPVQLVGYLNVPGQGPAGPSQSAGDTADVFSASLLAGQTVEIDFSADPDTIDVDLGIFDTAGNLIGFSVGLNSYECVRITADGNYKIASVLYTRDDASRGGTVYQMRVTAPGTGASCENVTQADAGIVPGEVIARLNESTVQVTKHQPVAALSRPVVIKGQMGPSRPALLAVPRNVDATLSAAGMVRAGKSTDATDAWQLGSGLSDSARRVLDTIDYAKSLTRSGLYHYATPNTRVSAYQVQPFPPNDRDYLKQRWHYESIDLPAAINSLAAMNPQPAYVPIVAVVDSGIVADHPDLRNQLVPGYDFVRNAADAGDGNSLDANPNDEDTASSAVFHGSHVAGTVAAQTWDGVGGAGVAPMARIMPIRALSDGTGTSYDVLQGVRFAAGLDNDSGTVPPRKADVINLSLGGNRACTPDQREVFGLVRAAGVVATIASGNESTVERMTGVGAPANCPDVISVGATDAQRKRARYSNGGPELMVVAPGGDLRASTTGNGLPDGVYSASASVTGGRRTPTYISIVGTSMAAPHAAGIVALMRFVAPGITPGQIDELIKDGSIVDDLLEAGRDNQTGYGQLNASKAVEAARRVAGGGAPTPPPVASQIEARPSSLSLGSIRESIEFELRTSGNTAERVVSVATDSEAIRVSPKVGAVGNDGLGTYVVTANRAALAVSASAYPNVVITLEPSRTLSVPVAIERRSGETAGGSLGPVYVLIVNPDAVDSPALAQAAVPAPVNGVYTYSVTVPGASRIVVVAGTDTDNDGEICNRGEGCGAYPILGTQIQVLEPRGDQSNIDFSISPFGGINSAGQSGQSIAAGDRSTMTLRPSAGGRSGIERLK